MAKRKVNKSELIREYFKSHPTAGLTEIAREISAAGHKVSPAHVNQALGGLRKGRRKKGRGRPVGSGKAATRPAASSGKGLDQLALAADFCKACGGVDSAIGVLNSLKAIASSL